MDDLASTQEATVEAFLHAFEQMDFDRALTHLAYFDQATAAQIHAADAR
jgi:limonene-1,2-epoxide hydrolase